MSDALDGTLPWWERALLRLHLTFCPTCPAVQASLTRTVEGLHLLRDTTVEPPAPPSGPPPGD